MYISDANLYGNPFLKDDKMHQNKTLMWNIFTLFYSKQYFYEVSTPNINDTKSTFEFAF